MENIERSTTDSKKKIRYHYRKDNGLCVVCGKPAQSERVTCDACAEKRRNYKRENTKYYRENNICPYCGKEKIYENEKMCLNCSEKNYEQHKNQDPEKVREWQRKKYEKRMKYLKENNLCRSCGKRQNAEGHTYCSMCLIKKRDKAREARCDKTNSVPRSERSHYGLCYICGHKLDEKTSSICTYCQERVTQNVKYSDRTKVPRIVYGKELNGKGRIY